MYCVLRFVLHTDGTVCTWVARALVVTGLATCAQHLTERIDGDAILSTSNHTAAMGVWLDRVCAWTTGLAILKQDCVMSRGEVARATVAVALIVKCDTYSADTRDTIYALLHSMWHAIVFHLAYDRAARIDKMRRRP